MGGEDDETTPLTKNSAPRSNSRRNSGNLRRRSGRQVLKTRKSVVAGDSFGSHGHERKEKKNVNFQNLNYVADESDVWRAHWALEHFKMRGTFWNHAKFKTIQTYCHIIMTGIVQAAIALGTNYASKEFIEVSRMTKFSVAGTSSRRESDTRTFPNFH